LRRQDQTGSGCTIDASKLTGRSLDQIQSGFAVLSVEPIADGLPIFRLDELKSGIVTVDVAAATSAPPIASGAQTPDPFRVLLREATTRLQYRSSGSPHQSPAFVTARLDAAVHPRSQHKLTTPASARMRGHAERWRSRSDYLFSARVDQMHLIEVGNKPHRLADGAGRRWFDTAAYFDPADEEIYHRFHAHRLDDIEPRLEPR
jgi:hypothetical protein